MDDRIGTKVWLVVFSRIIAIFRLALETAMVSPRSLDILHRSKAQEETLVLFGMRSPAGI